MSKTAKETREVPSGYTEVQLGPKLEVIPSDWEIESLSNWLSSLESGGRPKTSERSESDSVLSIGGAHISDGSFDLDDPVCISEVYYEGLNSGNIEKSDILLVKDGATIGKSMYVNKVPEGRAAVNSHVYILRVDQKQYEPRFLYYFINSRTGLDQILRLTTGTAQAGLNRTFQQATKVPTPSLPEQRYIADILSTVDEQIQQTDEMIEKARKLKRGVIQDALSSGPQQEYRIFGTYPKSWELKTLSSICEVIDAEHFTPDYVDNGIPVLRPGDLKPGTIALESVSKSVNEDIYEELTRKYVPGQDDLVYSRSQNFAIASRVLDDERYCIGQDMVVIDPKSLDISYLLEILNSRFILNQAQSFASGSTFDRLNLSEIRKLRVPLPDPNKQETLGSTFRLIRKKIRETRQERDRLVELKRGLMQDLLTGKVRVDTD